MRPTPRYEPPRQEPPEPPEPEQPSTPAPTRRLLAPIVGIAAALITVAIVVGVLTLPGLLASSGPDPRLDYMAWRVSDPASTEYLDGLLQRGWQIDRADTDGAGTTYILRRDPAQPTPRPRAP